MKGAVKNSQLFFALFLLYTVQSVISIPQKAIKAAGTGSWFSLLLLSLFFSLCVFFIAKLNTKFEDKTIFEYSQLLVGKISAYIITIIYASFFLFILISVARSTADFTKDNFLPLTPIWAILFIFIITCSFIASKGLTNLARMSQIYGAIYIVTAFLIHSSMIILGDYKHIMPFFEVKMVKQYIFGMKDLIAPFLGFEVLAFIPFGKVNAKNGVRTSMLSVLFVGLFYIFIVETSTIMLGINSVILRKNAVVEALRETRLPSTLLLERPDLLFLIVGFMGIIASLSIIIFITAESLSKIFSKANKNLLIVIVALTVFIMGLLIDTELAIFMFEEIQPVWSVFTALVIPVTLLIFSKVKRI